MKKILLTLFIILSVCILLACNHSDDDIKKTTKTEIEVYYNQIVLDWNSSIFTHDGYVINIPDSWGLRIDGRKEKFKEYDPHDIIYKYSVITSITYGGEEIKKSEFIELKYKSPDKESKIFEISIIDIDIDSKIFIKDELVNDFYYKYDTNQDFYNFCYFKIAKNDINQLKNGNFNQINVKLKYYKHIDSSCSFIYSEEKDGLNNIGVYSNVSILYNPDLS